MDTEEVVEVDHQVSFLEDNQDILVQAPIQDMEGLDIRQKAIQVDHHQVVIQEDLLHKEVQVARHQH